MLGSVLDVYRLRQDFNVVVRTRELVAGIRDDAGFLRAARRAVVRLPFERRAALPAPFPEGRVRVRPTLRGKRIGVVATGGSGAMASVVGVGRALEELGVTPAVISLCSGSALFGFPLAAGLGADKTAEVMLALDPGDYLDVAWRQLAGVVPTAGRGFAGIVHGDRIEAACRRWLGDVRLGELPIPAYAPIWNVEANRVEYLGPDTHPTCPSPARFAWRSPCRCSSNPSSSTAGTGATAGSSTSSPSSPCSTWNPSLTWSWPSTGSTHRASPGTTQPGGATGAGASCTQPARCARASTSSSLGTTSPASAVRPTSSWSTRCPTTRSGASASTGSSSIPASGRRFMRAGRDATLAALTQRR